MAFGDSPALLTLADGELEGVVQQRLAVGDNNPATNEPANCNAIIVKLKLSPDDAAAIREVQHWLEANRVVLGSIDSKKIIEFHIFLESNIGSRILTVPNSIVQICGELGLDVAMQAFRL